MRLRRAILDRTKDQRCEVEGPRERLLFSLEKGRRTGVLSFFLDDRGPCLDGGRVMGVGEGDAFAIMPPDAAAEDELRRMATATVTEVEIALSRVALDRPFGRHEIPIGAPAYPVSRAARRHPVTVMAEGRSGSLLEDALESSPYVRAAEPGETGLLARMFVEGGLLELHDVAGYPLVAPVTFGPDSIALALTNLETLARAASIRSLEGGAGETALETPFEVQLGRVRDQRVEPLPPSGAILATGDAIVIRIDNRGDEILYISVFDVGVDGTIELLTAAEPAGIELFPDDQYWLGYREISGLVGLRLSWPDNTPPVAPGIESLVVIAADHPMDLRALESTGIESLPHGDSARRHTIDLARTAIEAPAQRYAVKHLDFELLPPGFSDAVALPSGSGGR